MERVSEDAWPSTAAPSHPPIPGPVRGGGGRPPRPLPRAAERAEALRPSSATARTVGAHTTRQLLALCDLAGLGAAESTAYARAVNAALGPVAERPLGLPPGIPSFLSDDHTPVEFSLSFSPGLAPTLRVLFEPASGFGTPAESSLLAQRALRGLAGHWGISTEQLDAVSDLFLPDDPQGAFSLWIALELLPGGTPRMKAYLNPAANGAHRTEETVRAALRRLGHHHTDADLPDGDQLLFLALDLGDWPQPRLKIYTTHHGLTPTAARSLSRMPDGPAPDELEAFVRTAAGLGPHENPRLALRPVQTCHGYTGTTGSAGAFTAYVPVRDYAPHDGEVLDRAALLLHRYGIDPAGLRDALGALTPRPLEDGVGLISYLALAHQHGRTPRITAYLSSEAYRVRPPNIR
ncbi:tryptophan dimethylallyltransferase family protein [Kitasatospora cineracea]|uniref:tryptophan dimethylallyltransferase family protein n=1 Tax=Kitasatospora cineracea TaxID=88074 RepID=UPI003446842C